MVNLLTKYLLLLMLLSFYFSGNSLPSSHAANTSKEEVLIMPIEAVDLEPETIKSLTNSYLSKLKSNKKYKFLSGRKTTETNLMLLTTINKKNKGYSLNSKIINISNGSVLFQTNKECGNCRTVSLKKLIEDLAKGIGKKKTLKKENINKKSSMEEEFRRLQEMDLLSDSLFPPKKKLKAWKKYLSKQTKDNPGEEEVKKRIRLLEIDLAFGKTDKSASKTESLNDQEKLWKKFLSKYEMTGRESTINKAKRKIESITLEIKEEERKKIRERSRRRRRLRRNN